MVTRRRGCVNGLAYWVEGQGPAVYMVHGIGAGKEAWEGVVAELAGDFTCVCYDLRGHGESAMPTVLPRGLAEHIADLETVRRRLGHARVRVMGHSLGGMIAAGYVRAYPKRVGAVGLISTVAGRGQAEREQLQVLGEAMEERGVEGVVKALVARWFTDDFMAAQGEVVEARVRQLLATRREVFLDVFWLYAKTEMLPWLEEVGCAAMLVTGRLDVGCSARLNRVMAGALPKAELVVIEGVKHALLLEAPRRVGEVLLAFLVRQER